jgi:shikimate kinase
VCLQVGLAGSSAIVSALVKALMEFYRLDDSDINMVRDVVIISRVCM